MTGKDIHNARAKLGKLWRLGRPLYMTELGEALRLTGRDPGATVRLWERGSPVSGPVSVAIAAMLAGYRPDHLGEVLRD